MFKLKTKNSKLKNKTQNVKFLILNCSFAFCILSLAFICFAQEPTQPATQGAAQPESPALPETPVQTIEVPKPDFEFILDINSKTAPLPNIFSPSIDLSGRGHQKDNNWPYHISARETIEEWQKEMGFKKGLFRLHWNFWETYAGKKAAKGTLSQITANYEAVIQKISDSGGIVILNLYGTPAGMGRALDKRSPPANLKQWKIMVKNIVRYLSCEKKYNIWYEVWDAPDTDNFFLGDKKDYFNLYRYTAEAIKELRREKKTKIPLGGPAVTWWFQNLDGNSIFTPEKSLIYELLKFCSQYKLPLDFLSWHAYSSDPYTEKETTTYNKPVSELIRDWLTFFRFDKNTPLIIDEWNFDSGSNIAEERGARAQICAS